MAALKKNLRSGINLFRVGGPSMPGKYKRGTAYRKQVASLHRKARTTPASAKKHREYLKRLGKPR